MAVLWVAPTKAGGFCTEWSNFFGGGCVKDRRPPSIRSRFPEVNPFLLGLTWSPDARGVLQSFSGNLLTPEAERVLVKFADGEEAEIPVLWVSPPIDAGFYSILGSGGASPRRPPGCGGFTAEDKDGGSSLDRRFG